MNRLLFVITYTPDIVRLKTFYRDVVGLRIASESPFWVTYESDQVMLGLLAIHPGQPRGIELCFESHDLAATVARLRDRGVEFTDDIAEQAFGKVIHLRDSEGNIVSVLQPESPPRRLAEPPAGARFATAIVNCRDMVRARAFYRDRLGLRVSLDSPSWVEFESNGSRLAMCPRADLPERDGPHGAAIRLGFAAPELMSWAEEARARGLTTLSVPGDEGLGLRAEATDPDGSSLVFTDVLPPPSLEEQLALPFEDDDVSPLTPIRKPVHKGAGAVSRLVVKPGYRSQRSAKKEAAKRKAAKATTAKATMKATKKVHGVRGAGPSGARMTPKRTRDPKRARNRPATGRLKKAERRTLAQKRRAVARVSKARPVKRASAKRPTTKRGRRR